MGTWINVILTPQRLLLAPILATELLKVTQTKSSFSNFAVNGAGSKFHKIASKHGFRILF